MVPTYLPYLTSQFVDNQSNSSWQLSFPYCTQQHFRWLRLSPATWSLTTKAGDNGAITNRKDEAATAKLSAYAHGEGWRKWRAAMSFGMIASWNHQKCWVERHCMSVFNSKKKRGTSCMTAESVQIENILHHCEPTPNICSALEGRVRIHLAFSSPTGRFEKKESAIDPFLVHGRSLSLSFIANDD